MNQIDNLLKRISVLSKKYDEISSLSGEKFNIFNLLGVNSDEVIHSKILAMLLDPHGMHQKQDVFLKCFLEELNIKDFNTKNAAVKTEYYIGQIDESYESGGRIDIVINSNKQIIIENKIYASDQKNQLSRYRKSNPDAIIIYLTLDGRTADDNSLGDLDPEDIINISYKDFIIQWLGLCRKESVDFPTLRETITQYINVLRELTGQTRSEQMADEIVNVLSENEDNVSAAFDVASNIPALKERIIAEYFISDLKETAKKFSIDLDIDSYGCLSSYWGFSFKKSEWKYVCILFEFESSDLRNLIYGLSYLDKEKMPKELDDELRRMGKSTKTCPIVRSMDKYKDWDKDVFVMLKEGPDSDLLQTIEDKIMEMIKIIEKFKL
jgi:hypothetical protein